MTRIVSNKFFLPVVVFICASVFRLTSLGLIEFKADEALSVFYVASFYTTGHIDPFGIVASTGMHNFPLFQYFLSILGFFSTWPQFLSFTIALINVIAITSFYILIKRFFGIWVSLAASLFIAFSPFSILLSRKIWAQDLIFPLMVPFLFFLNKLVLEKDKKSILWLTFFLMLLTQLHGSGIFLSLVTIVILCIQRVRPDFKKVLLGFLLGIIPAVPFIFFQLFNLCPDCSALWNYQSSGRFFDFLNFIQPFQIINNRFFTFILGKDYQLFLNQYPLISVIGIIQSLQILLIVGGAFYIFKFQRKFLFLVLFPLLLIFLFFITRTPSLYHYQAITFPFLALILGFGLKFISEFKPRKTFTILSIACLSIYIICNVYFQSSFLSFISQKQKINGDYGPIFSLTDSKNQELIENYQDLEYFPELRAYLFIFVNTDFSHQKLAEYFANKGNLILAKKELELAVIQNPDDKVLKDNLKSLEKYEAN